LYSLAIFALIPFGNTIQKFISDNLGKTFFIYLTLAVLGIIFIGLIYFLIYRLKIRSLLNYIWLIILAGLYVYITLKMRNSPVEVTHFLEYGLLSIFIFRALNHHIKDKTIYFSAAFIILLIGTLDEIIQWIVPGRVWNFKDAGLNVISGGLIQLAIWQVIRPKSISEKTSIKSLRIMTSLIAACFLILGLCVSNTSNQVYRYSNQIPLLYFLQKEEAMSEFGYKYKDPEIGIFYSRLSSSKLIKKDKKKGEKNAEILNESVERDYKQFIQEYNPAADPFMHELRVHIFRRDIYFKKGKKASSIDKKKESYFIAYKENLILEKYFPRSIKNSVYKWENCKIENIKTFVDEKKTYVSPVSSNLFTSFSERTVWIMIFSMIFILLVVNLFFTFKKYWKKK